MSFSDYLRKNLENWQEYSRKVIKPQIQDGKDQAGLQGEDFVRKLIVTHKHFGRRKNCLLLTNKRVPKVNGGGKREIDLILVSKKKLHIHEVKNWSGRLEGRIDDPMWTHYPVKGSPREVKNLTMDNAEKAAVISQFLSRLGIEVAADEIDYRTFFVDSKRSDGSTRLAISSKISSDESIVTTDKLGFYLNVEQADNIDQINFWQETIVKFLEKVISFSLGADSGDRFIQGFLGKIGKENHKKLVASLKMLPTWDQLIFYGTKIESGDIWGHYGFGKDWQNMFLSSPDKDTFSKIEEIANRRVNRKPSLNFQERIGSLGKSLMRGFMPLHVSGKGLFRPIGQLRGNPDYRLNFQPAGEKEQIRIPIMEIDRIIYGNRHNNENWLFNQI